VLPPGACGQAGAKVTATQRADDTVRVTIRCIRAPRRSCRTATRLVDYDDRTLAHPRPVTDREGHPVLRIVSLRDPDGPPAAAIVHLTDVADRTTLQRTLIATP